MDSPLTSTADSDDLARWKPRSIPDRALALCGARIRLVPVDADNHAEALYAASHGDADPYLWTYLFVGPFDDKDSFYRYLARASESLTDIFYTIVDEATGRPSGIASYLRIVAEHGVIEIGHIWFGSQLQRTAAATEAIYLLASHVFDDLGYRRLEWKCDAQNQRSRRAAERFGFSLEGIFRKHMVIKGRNRDTAWFAMLDSEWPIIRRAFQQWLAPENFDSQGRQLRDLVSIRATLTEDRG